LGNIMLLKLNLFSPRLGTSVFNVLFMSEQFYKFWFFLQNQLEYRMPCEIPLFRTHLSAQLQSQWTLVLSPKSILSSEELRQYSDASRKCYFANERRLKYFKQYTQNNCELECETDLVLEKCGCFLITIQGKS
jgi:hypothetical protein